MTDESIKKAFEAYKRQNPNVEPLPDGVNPGIRYPRFRHYVYIAQRSGADEGGVDPINEPPSPSESIPSSSTLVPAPSPSIPTSQTNPTSQTSPTGPSNPLAPQKSPSKTPTISPTKSPTKTPTVGEGNGNGQHQVNCKADSNGDINVDASSEQTETAVDYRYKIAYNPNDADLKTEVIPKIEEEILKKIAPDLFNCIGNSSRFLSESFEQRNRRLEVLGISSRPADQVSEDPCTVDDTGHKCNYIDGRMTLFTDGSDPDESSAVKNLVCAALNSKDMKYVHPAIKGIDCTFLNGSTPGENGGGVTPPVIAPASQSYATPVVVMSALAGIMVVFGVYAYRRRQRKDEPELPAHKAYLDDSDVNNSNSVSFDDAPMAWSAKHNTNSPAFDMHSIIPKGYSPETIEEGANEDDNLDEVSLDQLNMNVDDTDIS